MGDLTPQAVEFRNAPAKGVQVAADQIGWELRTEENWVPLKKETVSNFGDGFEVTLKKRGVYKKLLVRVSAEFTVTNGTGQITLRDIWPHGILRDIKVKGDQADIHQLNGWLAHAYLMRRNRNPDLSAVTVDELAADTTPADGTYALELEYEIPMCYDYATGVGATYGETDQAEFQLTGQVALHDEVFSKTGTAAVTLDSCTIESTMVFFDVPRDLVDGVDVMFVPDLSRLFQLQMRAPEVKSVGEFEFDVLNVHGNLTALILALRNDGANIRFGGGGLNWLQWGYGANLNPRLYRPLEHLEHENARMYDGLLPYRTIALDFDTENPRRDSTRPPGLTELVTRIDIPVTTSLTNARMYGLHESLVSAENGPAVVQR
jgi:hypothetical protein